MTTTAPDAPAGDATEEPTDEAPQKNPHPSVHLMAVVENRLAENQDAENRKSGGGRRHAGFLAAVRPGLTPSGDLAAHSATAPFTAPLRPEGAEGARRAAAIRVLCKDVPSFAATQAEGGEKRAYRPLGRSLRLLYSKVNEGRWPGGDAGRDQIESQVAMLPLLDTDAAALVLRNLIGRCAGPGVAVDFFDLARTLVYWGDGISPRSVQTRNKIVADFYGAQDDQ